MNSQDNRNGVQSPQIDRKERLYANDYRKYSKHVCGFPGGLTFSNFSVPSHSTAIRFFRFFPPVRFLLNTTEGIEKLKCLNGQILDSKGRENKASTVQRGDKGFNELAKYLNENIGVSGNVEKIHLVEQPAGIRTGISHTVQRIIVYVEDEQRKFARTDPFDPSRPIKDLIDWVDDTFRKQLAYWMIGLIAIWLILNSVMLYLLNK